MVAKLEAVAVSASAEVCLHTLAEEEHTRLHLHLVLEWALWKRECVDVVTRALCPLSSRQIPRTPEIDVLCRLRRGQSWVGRS